MIGLGVLATGSGATALTGATLSNTVSPTADFRVNVEAPGLTVKRGRASYNGTAATGSGTGDGTYIDGAASTALNSETTLSVASNDSTNGELDFGVLVPFDEIPDSEERTSQEAINFKASFPQAIALENQSGRELTVGIQYGDTLNGNGGVDTSGTVGYADSAERMGRAGTDVTEDFISADGGPDALSFDEVASIFDFSVNTGSLLREISPVGDNTSSGNVNQKPINGVIIEDNKSVDIEFGLNINQRVGTKIADFVEGNTLGKNGGAFALIDEIFVGETTVSGVTPDASATFTSS
jgi:hypothetical protein